LTVSFLSGLDVAAVFVRAETSAHAVEATAIIRIVGPNSLLYFARMSFSSISFL
jgi:hypothetical protein